MNKKRIFGTLAGAAMLLVTASPVLAVDGQNCNNKITGPFSVNRCKTRENTTQRLDLNQRAYVSNKTTINANTGGESNFNTITGGVTGGSVEASVKNDNDLNKVMVDMVQSGGGDSQHGANFITGPLSKNTVTMSMNKTMSVSVNQNATVNNSSTFNLSTGGTSNFNTITGGVKGGSVDVDVHNSTNANEAWLSLVQQ